MLVDAVQENGQAKSELIRFVRGVTRTPANAREFAERHSLPVSDNFDDALGDDIDAVVLASINSVHVDQIVAAAGAGKPVFVEKPLAFSRADAQRAALACEQAGVVLALGHNRRFLSATRHMKSSIDNGVIGHIVHVEGNYSNDYGMACSSGEYWVMRSEHPVGGMTTMGVHILDMMLNLVGSVATVRAVSRRQVLQTEADDTTNLLLDFDNGASGTLSTLTMTPRHWRVSVFGTKGMIEMDGYRHVTINTDGRCRDVLTFPEEDMELAELEAFARAAKGEEEFPLPVEQAVHNAAVLEAVIQSAVQGGAAQNIERAQSR